MLTQLLIPIGMILIFIGFLVIIIDLMMHYGVKGNTESRVRGGGVVIIGPVPIVFGSDKKMAVTAAIIGTVLTLITVLTYLYLSGYLRW